MFGLFKFDGAKAAEVFCHLLVDGGAEEGGVDFVCFFDGVNVGEGVGVDGFAEVVGIGDGGV